MLFYNGRGVDLANISDENVKEIFSPTMRSYIQLKVGVQKSRQLEDLQKMNVLKIFRLPGDNLVDLILAIKHLLPKGNATSSFWRNIKPNHEV